VARDDDDNPAILIEPTYTRINKGDNSMDDFLICLSKTLLPMKWSKVYRDGGDEKVSIGKSRNPNGQYEDLPLSSLRIID